jgi:hypothetical protein
MDGSSAFRVQIGLYRLVCSNGLTIGQTVFNERVTHIRGPLFETKMDEIEWRIAAAIEQLHDVVARLAGTALGTSISLVQERVLIESLGYSKRLTGSIIDALHSNNRRPVDFGTLWGTYNVINEVLREHSRSEYRNELINSDLMDRVLSAWESMNSPAPIAA